MELLNSEKMAPPILALLASKWQLSNEILLRFAIIAPPTLAVSDRRFSPKDSKKFKV